MNKIESIFKKVNPDLFLVYSLSFIYITFGFLKIIDKSPIKDLIVEALPFMDNALLLSLFGLGELILGLSILIKKTRLLGSIGIILHLLSTFVAIPLAWGMIYDSETILTIYGEFIAKNLILIAVAFSILAKEKKLST